MQENKIKIKNRTEKERTEKKKERKEKKKKELNRKNALGFKSIRALCESNMTYNECYYVGISSKLCPKSVR
jgi:hypothetical protein